MKLHSVIVLCFVFFPHKCSGRGKGKFHSRTSHEGPVGSRGITTLSSTSMLDGVGGQRNTPTALTPVKTRYPFYRSLGVPQNRSERLQKISPHRDSIPGPSNP
jgi:hypothetical protein